MNIGNTVSHYTILERLGQGGMGTVYRARDTKLGRVVAIKVLPPGVGSDDEQRERFLQEARAASALDHPNIGSVFEIDESPDGELFIVMAYYEGKNLREIIREGVPGIVESCRIGAQIARGMSEAHARGIIHRDIKPANVILTPQGLVKIIDFGLAKLADGLQLTRTGTSLGTLAYMSPEQLRAEDVGPESDVWALGIILFEMLAGRHPFHGEFEAALMYSIANEPPLDLRSIRPDLPPTLYTLITRMISKRREDRPSSMGEIADILERPVSGSDTATMSSHSVNISRVERGGSDRKPSAPWWRIYPLRLHTGVLALAAAVVIVIAGYLIIDPFQDHSTSTVIPSIAVIPFPVAGEEELKFLGEGMAGEISGKLARVPDLLVISRNSTGALSRAGISDSAVAESLGVRYLLHGTIRATVAQVFHEVFLYDHNSGEAAPLGSGSFLRRDITDFAPAIAAEVCRRIGTEPPIGAPGMVTRSREAYESYLQASFYRDMLRREDLDLSIAYYRQAIASDTAFLPARLGLASTLVEGHLQGYLPDRTPIDEAEAICRQTLTIDSSSSVALSILGKVLDLRGDRFAGMAALDRALSIDPENDYALTVLAQMYIFELMEPVKGIVLLRRLKQVDPLNWLTDLNLGVAFAQSGNHAEALQSFHQSAKLNPTHPWPVYSLGYLFERLGNYDSAASWYSAAIGLDPSDPLSYSSLIALDLATGHLGRADSLAVHAQRVTPGDYIFLYLRGLCAKFEKRHRDAERLFSDGYQLVAARLRKEPTSVEYTIHRGLYAARLGRTKEAVTYAEVAARLDSTHEETAIKIARIYASAGIKDRAIEWFGRARGMNPEYDEAYLSTAVDFEQLRNDPDLLLAARR